MTAFFNVFPELRLDEKLAELLKDAVVIKVTASRFRNRLRIYIQSRRLIHYGNIRRLEDAIGEQLFATAGVHIQVIEKYELSEQYTPERLMSIYFDSLEAELRSESDLEANIFKSAGKDFIDANTMVLTVPDNFITVAKIDGIRDKLIRIFRDRFGYDVDIRVSYDGESSGQKARYAEETFQREVEQIVKEYEANEKAEKEKQDKLKEQKKNTEKKYTRDNTFARKKIEDPDIFYGRPFASGGLRKRPRSY